MRMEQYLTFTDHALWEDAKSLWEAIKNRFGGNKESKKMQKTILKQNYKNFAGSSQEGLDKTYDSLPSAWNNIALIMRNKSDLDTLSMDDLYNNLKVYESEIKVQSSSSSNSHNVAFVSSDNSSNTNETVNTAHSVSTASSKDQASTTSYDDDVMFSFFSNQSNALQTKVECYNCHRRGHFTRECRARRNQGNRNIDTPTRNVPMDTSTTNALVVQNGIGSSSFDSEVHTCSKECLKSYEALQKQYDQQREALNKSNLEIIGYQIGLELLEVRIVVYEKNEAIYEEDIAFLKYDVQVKDVSIKEIKNQLENALKEKVELKLKLEKFETSSKNLNKLINSQISAIDKTGLGYDGQMNESDLNDIHVNESEVLTNVFVSRESDGDDNQVNDRFQKSEGYHVVPFPYIGNYMPPRADLSFAGLDNFVFKSKVSETITSVPKIKTNASKPRKDSLEKPKILRSSAPLIEEWESDSEDENVFKPKKNKLTHPHPKRNFIPAAVLTKFGQVPVNAAKQSSHREAASVSAARRVNTAASRPNRNNALPTTYSYFKAHSPVRRPFNQKSAAKTNNFNEKVNTVKVNNVTTAGPKAVVNAIEGNKNNAVKSLACWIWRPKGNLIDHISKDSGSYTLKRFNYVDPHGRLKSDQGIFDSGCSRHMTGNKFYFTDYQEINGEFVAFRGNSVSQMCDKKNSDLFTDIECVVLSPDFEFLMKVKSCLRCDNETEFKNRIMNEFYEMKGIRREFSVYRTP
nr:ribonuclease H-like domain-containing protein [Tanacetum cinerariifolium]